MTLQNRLRQEILSDIEAIAKDDRVFSAKNFILRSQAMDDIEFHVIDRIESLGERDNAVNGLNDLKAQAEKLRSQLEEVNEKMFQELRVQISQGGCQGQSFMDLLKDYLGQQPDSVIQPHETGYDHLDTFLNGLLTHRAVPVETKEKEPGMIFYQKTPARIVIDLIKKAAFQPDDVFYDLGSGLGQVTMLVNLLTAVPSKGVEFEPAYCNYAKSIATGLNLRDVDFIQADARQADYSSGTLFFMYTPFEGRMLDDVLHKLQGEAKKRKIRIFTYGSCTSAVAKQCWLGQIGEVQNSRIELAEFVSI